MFYSKLIFKKINFINIILSLYIITIPIQVFAFTQKFLIPLYLYILCTIFFIKLILDIKSYFKNKDLENIFNEISFKKQSININLISLFISILFTYKVWPYFWRFEEHDILYFGWLSGIFNFDYFGPIRIPTAYPELMSANHLMAGSLLIPFLLFCKTNLINSITVKSILISLSFFNYIKMFNLSCIEKIHKNKFDYLILANLVLIASFAFFSSELLYSLGISNYPIIILILTLANYCIINNQIYEKDSGEFIRKFFLFITLACISKAVTFPLFLLGTIFFLLNYKEKIKNFQIFTKRNLFYIFILVGIILISLLGWKIQSSNHGTLGGAFPICVLDGFEQTKDCFSSVFKNPFANWTIPNNYFFVVMKLIPFSEISGLSEFIYIWPLSIIPTTLVGIYINKKSSIYSHKLFGMFIKYYGFATALGVIFLRASKGYDGLGTAHGYLIMPVFILTCLHMIFLNLNLYKFNKYLSKIKLPLLLFLIPILIYYFNSWSPNSERLSNLIRGDMNSTDRISFTLDDFKKFEIKDDSLCTSDFEKISLFKNYLNINNCADNDALHLYYSMKGFRTNIGINSKHSIIKEWILNQ